jgi:Arginyl-tRNA synthetase
MPEQAIKRLMRLARTSLGEAGLSDPKVTLTKSIRFGLLTSTSAFEEARRIGADPVDHATRIARSLRLPEDSAVARVEAAPPGYINFHPDWRRFAQQVVTDVLNGPESYFRSDGAPGEVVIEHTSVNPNKALHIGHARNACIGDTLARLMRSAGARVLVINYIDDSGAQMAELLVGFKLLNYPMEPRDGMRFDEYCGDVVYVEVNRRAEVDPKVEMMRREVARKIEERGSEEFEEARRVALMVLRDQLKTTSRLGATYDLLVRESDVVATGLWAETFRRLREAGLARLVTDGPKKGCWVVDLSSHPVLSKEGDEVIVKSDGATTYVARDIAFAMWKMGASSTRLLFRPLELDGQRVVISDSEGEDLGPSRPDLVITVVDSRQRRPQEVVRYALERLGVTGGRYVHYSYEPVALSRKSAELLGVTAEGEVVHMSGRKGLYFKAEEVLEKLRSVAERETRERRPEWDERKVSEVAEALAGRSVPLWHAQDRERPPDRLRPRGVPEARGRHRSVPPVLRSEGEEDTAEGEGGRDQNFGGASWRADGARGPAGEGDRRDAAGDRGRGEDPLHQVARDPRPIPRYAVQRVLRAVPRHRRRRVGGFQALAGGRLREDRDGDAGAARDPGPRRDMIVWQQRPSNPAGLPRSAQKGEIETRRPPGCG